MAELGDPILFQPGTDVEVSVEMLDFDYIKQCKDSNLLKNIVRVLKSGIHGSYPEVICSCITEFTV